MIFWRTLGWMAAAFAVGFFTVVLALIVYGWARS